MIVQRYSRTQAPNIPELPFFNDKGGWCGYLPDVATEYKYWQKKWHAAENVGDIGKVAAAAQVLPPLQGVTRVILQPEKIDKEPIRRVGLGALALSRLMRDLFYGKEEPGLADPEAHQEDGPRFADPEAHQLQANLFVSLSSDEAGLPDGVTVFVQPHLIPNGMFPPDAPHDEWYERNGLIVRRTQLPHVLSPALDQYVEQKQLGSAFDNAVGLEPFVPTPSE